MFSNEFHYEFTGCYRNVLSTNRTPIEAPIKIKNDKIYLGEFLSSKPIQWKNNECIQDGLATFQYGIISFPNYREISICRNIPSKYSNKCRKSKRSISWNDKPVYFSDIYIPDIIE